VDSCSRAFAIAGAGAGCDRLSALAETTGLGVSARSDAAGALALAAQPSKRTGASSSEAMERLHMGHAPLRRSEATRHGRAAHSDIDCSTLGFGTETFVP
jgi:hypothetical protein